jgi:vancomycin resistance protein YoaR
VTATTDSIAPEPTTPEHRSGGWRRPLLWVGIAVLLVGAFYAALVAASGDGLPRGAKVLGVEVGGLSEGQAAAKLETELGPRATDPINATIGDDSVSIVPVDAGLSFDAAATVDGYAGRIWNPVTLITQFTGGPTITPVTGVDQGALDAAVKQLAADSDSAPVEPSIEVRGSEAVLVSGTNGRAMDQSAAAQALADAYLVTTDTVALPEIETTPSVPQDKADAALVVAKAAIAAPVTVKAGKVTADIPAEAIGRALAFAPMDGDLVGSLDGAILRTSIEDELAPVEKPGRDATWNVSSGKPVVVPSKVGTGINPDDLASAVAAVMGSTDVAARVVTPTLGTIEPKLTTEQAKALNVVERLGSFTQNFPYAAYRFQNIGQAGKYMNGTLLKPGEVFSLNKVIKERTVANGYTKGFVIGPGGVFKEDQGGGVSASATTAWSAAFYSGLERVYTQAHSIWIPRYRAGLEATVAWGSFDMKFKNDTPDGVYITTIMTKTSLTVTMWGTKVYDDIQAVSSAKRNLVPFDTLYDPSPTCHAQGGQQGFTIDVFRVFIKDGAEVKREKITTRYRPSPTVICGTDPKDKPTPSPSPSPSGSGSKSPTPKPTTSTSPSPSAT